MPSNTCHAVILRKASRRLTARYDAALAPLGISIAQFSLLRNLARLQPTSLTELAAAAELDRSTVGRNVKVIERMGLVTTATGEDHREALLQLSEAGQTMLRDGAPIWDGVQEAIDRRLGPEGARQLHHLLSFI